VNRSTFLVIAAAVSFAANIVIVAGVVVLLVGGSPATGIAPRLHLATLGQARVAQANADDAENQILAAQAQLDDATGTSQSLGDAISSVQGDISDLQASSDDHDSRISALETANIAACSWAPASRRGFRPRL
jgi:methylthioribose-1-phosphate isomerase